MQGHTSIQLGISLAKMSPVNSSNHLDSYHNLLKSQLPKSVDRYPLNMQLVFLWFHHSSDLVGRGIPMRSLVGNSNQNCMLCKTQEHLTVSQLFTLYLDYRFQQHMGSQSELLGCCHDHTVNLQGREPQMD